MFEIIIQTIVDAAPLMLTILGFTALVNLVVLVVTAEVPGSQQTKPAHRMTWDLTRDTRFINLD